MNASHLIERATRAHTVDGYTGHAALCTTYETIIRDLCQQLATLQGTDAAVAPGCYHETLPLGDTACIVEFEGEAETGDGFNEPREPACVSVQRAYLNGAWVSADCLDSTVVSSWEALLLRRLEANASRRKRVPA